MIEETDLIIACDYAAQKCGKRATYVLTGHMLDYCDTPLVMMLCPEHTAVTLQTYGMLLPAKCMTCSQQFESLHDLIDVSHIVKGLRI